MTAADRCVVVTTHVDQAWTTAVMNVLWIVGMVALLACLVAFFVSLVRPRRVS